MRKPKWDSAPDWARYLCRDYDGQWYWSEIKPDFTIKRPLDNNFKVMLAGEDYDFAYYESKNAR